MRIKAEAILEFGVADEQQNAIVREYRNEYKALSQILDKQPKMLELVHRDLKQLGHSTSPRRRIAELLKIAMHPFEDLGMLVQHLADRLVLLAILTYDLVRMLVRRPKI